MSDKDRLQRPNTDKDRLPRPNMWKEPWLCEKHPYNFTATGYLGVKRQAMLTNPLLRRSRMSHGWSTSDNIFGNEYRCRWTAADALTGWSTVTNTEKKDKQIYKKKTNIDHLSLNRAALSASMITSNDNCTYRQSKAPIEQKGSKYSVKRQERPFIQTLNAETIFGAPVKRESIQDLTTHWYQRKYLNDSREGEITSASKFNCKQIRPTRASILRRSMVHSGVYTQPWRNSYFTGNEVVKRRKNIPLIHPQLSNNQSCGCKHV